MFNIKKEVWIYDQQMINPETNSNGVYFRFLVSEQDVPYFRTWKSRDTEKFIMTSAFKMGGYIESIHKKNNKYLIIMYCPFDDCCSTHYDDSEMWDMIKGKRKAYITQSVSLNKLHYGW